MTEREPARNEPCPCGSGKKFKRCHGVSAAPKITPPKQAVMPEGAPDMAAMANNMNPEMMSQVSQALQRLPKGQMQRLQGLMQKAMAGKDVSREAAEFERTLPPEFQQLMSGFAQSQGMVPPAAPEESGMSEEEARRIVEEAAAAGKISQGEAETLLKAEPAAKASGLSRLWKGIKGNK